MDIAYSVNNGVSWKRQVEWRIIVLKKGSLWAWFPVTFTAALFCCILWGSATPAIKIAYKIFNISADDTASRIMLAGSRFVIAGLMVIVFGSMISRKILVPKKTSVKQILILSCFQTVGQYFFFFMALAHTTGVRGSIINAAGNFLTIIMAVYVFRMEKMTVKKLAGCIVGFAGIVLILGGASSFTSGPGVTLAGEGAMITADIFYALSGCCIKIFSKDEDPVILSGYQFFIGGVILFMVGWAMGGALVFSGIGCLLNLLYMGFISAGAYSVWGILLKYNPVSRVSIFGFMNPVLGVLLSAVFLGENREAFSLTGLFALVLVSLGIVIVNKEKSYGH